MPQELARIMQYVRFENDIVKELQKRVLGISSRGEAESLRQELEWRLDVSPHVHHYELSPFFYLLISYCYLWDNHEENAIRASTNAIEKFRLLGMAWFQGLAYWIRACLLQHDHQNTHRRINDLLEARKILEQVCENYRLEAQYERYEACQEALQEIDTDYSLTISKATKPLGPLPKRPSPSKTPSEKDRKANNYLSLGWLPIYQKVRAGLEGTTWADPPHGELPSIYTIEIGEILHRLISLRGHKVTLVKDFEYGWAQVKGNSMNNAKPVPINENDYVLFLRVDQARNQDIVIATRKEITTDLSYMVKRYNRTGQTLSSETTDKTQAHNPIELSVKEHQILGVVLAVAKPILQDEQR